MAQLFLDDVRKPPIGDWDVVRDYYEFITYIRKYGCPDVISFDHDLSTEHYPLFENIPTMKIPYETYKEKTGYDCAKWLLDNNYIPKTVIIHSYNMAGAANIRELFKNRKLEIKQEPYHV